jgi:hypothetical protein
MIILKLIPIWVKILLVSFLFACYTAYVHNHATISERNTWEARLAESERVARVKEQNLQSQVDKKANENEQLKSKTVLSANAARNDNYRLRNTINQFTSQSTETTGSTDAARIGELFTECTDRYTGLAKEADQLAVKVTGLQDYAKIVSE